MQGMNYVLHNCPKHGLVQHAEALGILLCVPCLVQKAIHTGDILNEPVGEMHLEVD